MWNIALIWQLVVTCIIWEDSTSLRSGWMSIDEAIHETPVTVYSCGILLGEDESKIVLAIDKHDDSVNQVSLIMKSLIRQRLEIDVAAEADRQEAAKMREPPK